VVTIAGIGFGSAEGASSVTVGGLPAVTLFWSDTQIQAQIPTGTGLGNQNVVVTVGGQTISNTTFNVTSGLTGISITPSATGIPASVTIDTPGQTAPLIFQGVAEEVAYVQISNSTFPGCYSLYFSIINKLDNSTPTANELCNISSGQLSPIVLPDTGTYTVFVDPQNGSTGSANINLWLSNNLVGTITSGTPVPVAINIPGQEQLLTFSGAAGQTAYLNISDSTFPGCYSLYFSIINNLDNSTPTANELCNLSSGQLNPIVLPDTGTYTVVVDPQNGSTGRATVSLTLTYPTAKSVNMSASLVQSESWLGNPFAVNVTLAASNGAVPPGTVTCSGAGVTSSPVAVSPNGTATVQMNGLPLGKDTIVCSFASSNLLSFSNSASYPMIESVIPVPTTGSVSVTPASATLYAGETLQFSASVFNTSNQAVTWSLPSGAPGTYGTVTASGLYTAPSSIATQETLVITATGQASGASSTTVLVTLLPAPLNPALTLSATVQPPYVTGTTQSFVVALKDRSGAPIAGEVVTFTVAGANSTTGTVTTDANGAATFTYLGANSGNDAIQAAASVSSEQLTSNNVLAVWIVPAQSISTTSVVGQFFFYNPQTDWGGGLAFNTPPTAIPAFTQVFPNICFNPPNGAIPGNTTIGTGTHPFTDVTTDENGNFTGTIIAQGNGYQAGWNEQGNGPAGFVQNQGIFQSVFTGSYLVASAGDAVINVYVDNNFILGVGGGATPGSGNPALGPGPATTPFEQLPVMGNSGYNNSIGGFSMTVHFPGPGTYPYELDYVECCGGGGTDTLSLMMSMGPIGSSGLPPAGAITITPGSLNPLPAGGQQAFTVQAIDASGNPVPNLGVALEINGADSQELKAITNASGTASFTYQDVNPGTASVQAVAMIDGMVTFSNQVSVPWTLPGTTNGGSGTLAISITADSTVTLPNMLQLTGTATDSGLPAGSSPTITWSELSGPATIIFKPNPNQASATATFTVPGNYVVELSASDSVPNAGSVQWPVTVNPAQQDPQGWIGSPTYGSAVSGIVPITLASGVSLQTGGTPAPALTYYPANNLSNAVALPITAESGTIATLDTTTLQNGSYWIQLQATDTAGQQQYSLVLVTVSGNYKPGRVTATVTDLVVPATGLAINIQRTYDSLNAATSSDFGYGWSLGINVNLTVDPAGDVTFTLGGQRKTFYFKPQMPGCSVLIGCLFPYFYPAYTPEPGLHGTLTDSGLGCPALDILVPNGNLWYCQNGGQYNPPGYVYTDPNGTAYTISAAGNLQSIQDLSGNGLTITASGITSTTGLSVPFVRDSSKRITQITDPAGNIYQYGYDANGNLSTVTYPVSAQSTPPCPGNTASGTSTYTYDPTFIHLYAGGTDGRGCPLPTSAYYPSGSVDTSGNSLSGRLQSVTDAYNEKTSYAYNIPNLTTTITYPDNNTATMVYDSFGDLLTYDVNGNKVSDTDALGNTTKYVYDALNRLVETDYPDQTKSTKTYDFRNNVIKETDQAKNVTQHVYDAAGRQTSVTRGYGSTTTAPSTTYYTYYDDGRKATETDPAGNLTNYYYDAAGRLTSVIGAQGVMQYGYDDAGNRTSSTDGNSNKTSFQYDARKRLIETDYPATAGYPDGTSVKNTYDGPGNLASVTDQNKNVVQYTYDAANQLKTVVQVNSPNAPANTNQYSYDPLGNLTALADENTHTTQNLFDLYGEPLQKTLPIATFTESRTYDPAGNLSTLTHFNGKTTTYAYDALNRLLSRTTPGEPSDSVSFTYTATGKYLTSTGQDGTVNYTYDALDRLATKVTPEGTLSYTYYPTGKVETIASSNPNGVSAAYTWDDQNRLATVVDGNLSGQNTTTYSYDDASNVATVKIPNGLTSTFTYDALNRLTELSTPPVADYKYTHGATGIRTNATELNEATQAPGRTLQWSYDNIYRLTNESISGDTTTPTPIDGSVSYQLDPVGNRTSMNSSLPGINSGSTPNFNADDQLTTAEGESYDLNGNTTQTASGNQYTYDSENHLIKMVNGSTVVTMQYDAFGNRVSKTVTTASGTTTTQYLVEDDVNPTGYPQVVEELVNGAVTRQYTYGLQRISENLSPAVTGNSTWTPSFYGYDGGGSVRQLTNSAGTVTDTYAFDAFGNTVSKTGTTQNNFLYRGEQLDLDLGLYYLRARYYNPATGRFMSRDPEDGNIAIPATLHKYLYTGGDPVNWIDPRGREEFVENGSITKLVTLTVVTTAIVYGRNGLSQLACDANAQLYGGGLAVAGYSDIELNFANCSASGVRAAPAPAAPLTGAGTGSPVGPEDPNGCGGGGGGSPSPTSPYTRPYVRQWVKDEVAENIDFTEDGLMIDPNSGVPFAGPPHLGHAPGFEFWKMAELAKQNGLTQQEFNEMMQDPEFYNYEDPVSNQSHCYEEP
jgi:RHS repeat-associated protein